MSTMKPACRAALSRSSWRISSMMSEMFGRHASERRVKSEEDSHALARSVFGLRVFDSLRQKLRQGRNGFFYARLVDSTNVLQDRRQGNLFVHEVLVVEDLAQKGDEVVVEHPGEPIGVSNLDDVQELIKPRLFLLCCCLLEDSSNSRVFEALKTVGKPLRDESRQARQGFHRQLCAWMPLAPGTERVLPGNSGFCSVWAYPQGLFESLESSSNSGSGGEGGTQFQDAIHACQGACFRT